LRKPSTEVTTRSALRRDTTAAWKNLNMLEMVAEKGRSGEPALELSNTVRTVFGVYAAFASGERLSAVSRAEVNVGEDGASANCAGDGILENVLLVGL